jgi:hypothetical protein
MGIVFKFNTFSLNESLAAVKREIGVVNYESVFSYVLQIISSDNPVEIYGSIEREQSNQGYMRICVNRLPTQWFRYVSF